MPFEAATAEPFSQLVAQLACEMGDTVALPYRFELESDPSRARRVQLGSVSNAERWRDALRIVVEGDRSASLTSPLP